MLQAFGASDPAKEQNLFCRAGCHLAKSSHRLTSVDIENFGALTLLDVLAFFPGILVKKDHFGRPTIGLHGLVGQNRIQFLIDGLRQNDPLDGSAILSLPASVIDFVDVYYGPGGTWFGEGSLIGVVSVVTKQMPELQQFGHVSFDRGVGGGFSATQKRDRLRAGVFGTFSSQEYDVSTDNRLSSEVPQFPLSQLTAASFFEYKLSSTAQAFLLARTMVAQEYFSGTKNYGFGQLAHTKLAWNSDLHLLKKKAQKNALDLFMSCGYFTGESEIDFGPSPSVHSYQKLTDRNSGLRFELGTKFHTKPFDAHDLFFGFGGMLQGERSAFHEMRSLDQNQPSVQSPTVFARPAHIFGRPSALFVAPSGHFYGYIQDEWQIRAPLLFTVGTRVILPIESKKLSGSLLPNIGVVLIPMNRLRFTIALHSSMRTPTAYEQSDRAADAMIYHQHTGYQPSPLEPEKSRTIESSIFYGGDLGTAQLKTDFGVHVSKIDSAISTTLKAEHSNQNEIHFAGIRSVNEIIFRGGHALSVSVFYSMAFRKEFDAMGYSTCQAGFFKGISARRLCPFDQGVPRLMTQASLHYDLASWGAITTATSFLGYSSIDDLITEPAVLFDATYRSKPLWRYISFFASVKTSFYGYHYRAPSPDLPALTRSFVPQIFATVGWNVNI